MTQEALNHVVSGTLCGFVDYLSKHFFLPPKLDASQLITAFLVENNVEIAAPMDQWQARCSRMIPATLNSVPRALEKSRHEPPAPEPTAQLTAQDIKELEAEDAQMELDQGNDTVYCPVCRAEGLPPTELKAENGAGICPVHGPLTDEDFQDPDDEAPSLSNIVFGADAAANATLFVKRA